MEVAKTLAFFSVEAEAADDSVTSMAGEEWWRLTACSARDEEVLSHFGQEVNFHMISSLCRCAW